MATFEPSPDLDPAVAQAIQQAMAALRTELAPHLAAPQPAAESEPDRLARLEEALGALDAATTQADLLAELLRQAGRFATRSAFLVLDENRFHGWAAYGFDVDQETVTRAAVDAGDGPWSRVTDGSSAAELDAADCARIVDQLGGAPAEDGLLVAFSLRGHTAGALYADRPTVGGPLNASALRILTYVGAQALETLPLRRGPQTAAVAQAPAVTVDEAPPARGDVDLDQMIEEVEVAGETQQEIVEIRRDTAPPPFEPGAEPSAPVVDEPAVPEVEAPEPEALEPVPDEVEPTEPEPAQAGAPEISGFETVLTEPEPDREAAATDARLETEASFETETGFETETDFETAVPELETEAEAPREEAAPPAADDEVAAEIEEALPEEVAFATQDIATLESPPTPEEEESAPAPRRPLEPTEVAPPADLDGPGWAFGGPATITDDSRHEEARRLARLLVTEIKLYNEEKVREGREQHNLTDQLRDDLERSRRIYEERIDEEIRAETDYFQEECVRILAGGDSTALGA